MTTTVFLAAVCSDPAAVNSLKPRLRVSHSFGSTRPRRDWRRRRDARTVGLIPQSRRPGSCGAIKVPPRPQPLAHTQDPSPPHWPFPSKRPPPKLNAAPAPCVVIITPSVYGIKACKSGQRHAKAATDTRCGVCSTEQNPRASSSACGSRL